MPLAPLFHLQASRLPETTALLLSSPAPIIARLLVVLALIVIDIVVFVVIFVDVVNVIVGHCHRCCRSRSHSHQRC